MLVKERTSIYININALNYQLDKEHEGISEITATFRRSDGRTLHVRKATRAEAPQQAIYDALGVGSAAGGIRKSIV